MIPHSDPVDLSNILSETSLKDSAALDSLNSHQLVALMNRADHDVAAAVAQQQSAIARAVDVIVARLRRGGRLIYCGAGTSGRLGILDAVECRPTFSVSDQLVQGCIAGGERAILHAVEGAEDNPELGRQDLESKQLNADDVVVGIAASGRTPYVIGALAYAQSQQAATIALSCNSNAPINQFADQAIAVIVGPEILTGSTRLKAGTAQKMVLNMLSTATMVQLGKTYGNLMVDVNASNQKLIARATRIVCEITQCDEDTATRALEQTQYHAKTAIVCIKAQCTMAEAIRLLEAHQGHLRSVLDALN